MKRCPSCQRVYTDDTLRFCLDDGASLVSEGSSNASPETLRIPTARSTDPTPGQTPHPDPILINQSPPPPTSPARRNSLWVLVLGAVLMMSFGITAAILWSRNWSGRDAAPNNPNGKAANTTGRESTSSNLTTNSSRSSNLNSNTALKSTPSPSPSPSNADDGMTTLPASISECETYSAKICGTWVRQGDHFAASWPNGARATIRVERFDDEQVILRRSDTAPGTEGFTARYVGQRHGNKIESGTVIWNWHGRSWSGTWTAQW